MADDLLAQAQLLHDAQNTHDAKHAPTADASGNGLGAPGTKDMGVSQGPTPAEAPDWVDKAGQMKDRLQNAIAGMHHGGMLSTAMNPAVQEAASKAMDYVGGYGRLAAAKAAGAVMPGPNPVGMADLAKTVKGQAPHSAEYAERLGVSPDLLKMGVDVPGTNHKRITVGDMTNLVGDTATNPLTYGVAGMAGRKLYNNAIAPVEIEGTRFGKDAVGDTMYKNGIRSPLGLQEKVQGIVDQKMETARDLERKAAGAGAEVDMDKAMAPAKGLAADAAARAVEPQEVSLAKRMKRAIDSHMQLAARPGEDITRELPYTVPKQIEVPQEPLPGYKTSEPGTRVEADIDTSQKGPPGPTVQGKYYYGPNDTRGVQFPGAAEHVTNNPTDELIKLPRPMNRTMTLEPKTATVLDQTEPTQGPSPIQTARMKTAAYQKARDNAYDSLRRSDAYQTFRKAQGAGLKTETEASIGRALGPEQEAQYRDANEEAGKLLSTGKAQARVSNQAQREFDSATSPVPTSTESLAGTVASGGHDLEGGLRAAAVIKLLRAIRLGQMPVGSMMRSIPTQDLQMGVLGSQLQSPWRRQDGQEK